MSSEETTVQIEVVEQTAKPKKIIKIKYKELYQYELKQRKKELTDLKKNKRFSVLCGRK